MHNYKIEGIDNKESTKLLEDWFLIENSWICHYCNQQNATVKKDDSSKESKIKRRTAELAWMKCKSYKPIEFYPSFYYDRDKITKEEIEILEKRRHFERKNVSKKDSKYNEK